MSTAATSIAQRKPATEMSPTELQHEADALALRICLHSTCMDDSLLVIELANRLARVQPKQQAVAS